MSGDLHGDRLWDAGPDEIADRRPPESWSSLPGSPAALPKIGSSVTAGVFGEAATITASDIALETVRLSMLKFGTRTIGSSERFADASPDAR